MAVFTRINGDAFGSVNVDAGRTLANSVIINTGIAAPITIYKIVFATGNLAVEAGTGGGVETALRVLEGNATVLAYQFDPSVVSGQANLSVITERSGWTDSGLNTMLTGLGNIGIASSCTVGSASSANGLKLA
jgi:hypothetical protein